MILVMVIGAIVGSFLGVLIQRIPRQESIISPASHCDHCQETLRWRDKIPVISFILLRGRCRLCQQFIGWSPLLIELITIVMFEWVYLTYGTGYEAVKTAVFLSMILVAVFIDAKHLYFPNRITLGIIFLGFLFSLCPYASVDTESAFLGAAIFTLPFFLIYTLSQAIYRRDVFGLGDVKLATGIGCFLGYVPFTELYNFFFTTFLLASVYAILIMVLLKKGRDTKIPLGPFMGLSVLAILVNIHIFN